MSPKLFDLKTANTAAASVDDIMEPNNSAPKSDRPKTLFAKSPIITAVRRTPIVERHRPFTNTGRISFISTLKPPANSI